MNSLGQLISHEIGLSLRSKTFWLLGILAVAAIFIPALTLLLLQFIVIAAVTRDQRTGFAGILASLPYHTAQLSLARALATLCLLLALWPLMVLTVGFMPGLEPAAWLLNARDLAALSFHYLILCLIAVGFVFFSSSYTRRPGRLYLIHGIGWLLGILFDSNAAAFPYWNKLYVLGSRAVRLMAPATALGFFPEPDIFPALIIYQVALGLLLWLLGTIGRMAKRGERWTRARRLPGMILLTVLIGSVAGVAVWQGLERRESAFRLGGRETDRLQRVMAQPETNAAPLWESCDLRIKLHSAEHRLEGRAELSLRLEKPADRVFFTLRNYLAVESVALADGGERLQWRRDGSVLAVRLPERYRQGGRFTFVIVYSGVVWEWGTGVWARPSGPLNFVTSSFSLLRSGQAWYPVPCVQPLYIRQPYTIPGRPTVRTAIWAGRAVHPAVAFRLTVDSDTDNMVLSNLERTGVETLTGAYKKRYRFGSLRGRDVFLLAGPYCYQKKAIPDGSGFMEIYAFPQHRARITAVLNSLAKPYRFYRDLLQPAAAGSGKNYTLLEMPALAFLASSEELGRDLTLTDTVLLSEDIFQTGKWRLAATAVMQENKRSIAVLQRWLQEDITAGGSWHNGNISEGLMLYLFMLHAAENGGRAFYDSTKANLRAGKGPDGGEFVLPWLAGGPVVRDVFLTLDEMRTADPGATVLKQVTRRLYEAYLRQGSITPADFAGTVRAVLAGSEWPRSKTDLIRRYLQNIARNDRPGNRDLKHGLKVSIFTFRPEEWLP